MATVSPVTVLPKWRPGLRPHRLALVGSLAGGPGVHRAGRRQAIVGPARGHLRDHVHGILLTTEASPTRCGAVRLSPSLLLVPRIIVGVVALRRVLVSRPPPQLPDRRANAELAVVNAQLQARERVRQHMLLSVAALTYPSCKG